MSLESMESLKAFAQRLPKVEKGVACDVQGGEGGVPVPRRGRLHGEAEEVPARGQQRAKKEPARYKPGASGWVKVMWTPETSPDHDVLKKCIEESYRLMAATK
jgi:hypothetical protein